MGLADLEGNAELPLQMDHEGGPIPLHAGSPEGFRGLLEVLGQRLSDGWGQPGGAAGLPFRSDGRESLGIHPVDPPGEGHPREPEDFDDPTGPLPLQEEQERGDLQPDSGARDCTDQSEQLCAGRIRMREFQTGWSHT